MATENQWRTPHEYKISGVPVSFPVKAYPSQMAMMSKIIGSLQKGRNCLLESPTGSGKSLALLCAALAWQRSETEAIRDYNLAVREGLLEPESVAFMDENSGSNCVYDVADNAGFFAAAAEDDHQNFNGEERPPKNKKRTIPKIYFGTRTHKQISQIIRELKKTAYKDVRMSILASRDHTCIEANVSKMRNRNEGCKELRENGGCSFMANVRNKLSDHHALNSYRGKKEAWDLEELVQVGKKVKACPYYTSRELKNRSEIIFCPYNYLVEPMIRKSMEIVLKNNIVILDEAHNIEDSARSAASWNVSQTQVRESMQDLEKMAKFYRETQTGDPMPYASLADMCSKISVWMDEAKSEDLGLGAESYKDYGSTSKVWTGTHIVAKFSVHGLGPDQYNDQRKWFEEIMADVKMRADEEGGYQDAKDKMPMVHANTTNVLEGFFTVMGFIYTKDQQFRDDFRVALVKSQEQQSRGGGGNSWMSKGGPRTSLEFTYSANFWCLNPAVIFDELKESVRSIVLTSGTLSPMSSFSSELDVEFPIQLEANHVIDKKQVWIGTLSHGPQGQCLKATYEHTESFSFQDEIGRLTLGICSTIAHGVLLFLPSYKMLNKLCERWQTTGLWDEILQRKVVVTEPRFSDEFEASIRHFYEVIEATSKTTVGSVDGALFIAVCRGKVSEGLDFADNNARAVICLGIPFPNIKDVQVNLKMKYNDCRNKSNKTILTGREWYEIQAFRALNQALGRCIRHRRDWGAILMVDQRYGMINRYVGSLSKWVRSGVCHYNNCQNVLDQLQNFSQEMTLLDEEFKLKSPPPEVPKQEPDLVVVKQQPLKEAKLQKKTKRSLAIGEWLSKGGNSNSSSAPNFRRSCKEPETSLAGKLGAIRREEQQHLMKENQVKKGAFSFKKVSETSEKEITITTEVTTTCTTSPAAKKTRINYNFARQQQKKPAVEYCDSDDDFQ